MKIDTLKLGVFVDGKGRAPFIEFLDQLRDPVGKTAIQIRIARIRAGNLGDFKPLGSDLFELRIHSGPGYRVYLGKTENKILILLGAGSK